LPEQQVSEKIFQSLPGAEQVGMVIAMALTVQARFSVEWEATRRAQSFGDKIALDLINQGWFLAYQAR